MGGAVTFVRSNNQGYGMLRFNPNLEMEVQMNDAFIKCLGGLVDDTLRTADDINTSVEWNKYLEFKSHADLGSIKPNDLAFIYCDLVEPNPVGEQQASLLQIMPLILDGEEGKINLFEPHRLTFYKLLRDGFNTIRFQFARVDGSLHEFKLRNDENMWEGNNAVLVTLLFRKIKKIDN